MDVSQLYKLSRGVLINEMSKLFRARFGLDESFRPTNARF